jgi:hypothetical protein
MAKSSLIWYARREAVGWKDKTSDRAFFMLAGSLLAGEGRREGTEGD